MNHYAHGVIIKIILYLRISHDIKIKRTLVGQNEYNQNINRYEIVDIAKVVAAVVVHWGGHCLYELVVGRLLSRA